MQLRARSTTIPSGGFTLRTFYRRELDGRRVLLADDVRNTGETFARCAALVKKAGGTVLATAEIYDRLEAIADIGVPNYRAGGIQGARELQASACPLCAAQVPITRF